MSGIDNETLCERLRDQQRDVEKIGWTLKLLVRDQYEIDSMVCRINAWIDDAIAALRSQEPRL